MNRAVWLLAPAWAVGASVYVMFAPLVGRVEVSQSLSRDSAQAVESAPRYSRSSWYATQGPGAARPLVVPIVLSFLPFLGSTPRLRRILGSASVLSLGAFCALAAISVGSYYMPSVAALAVALGLEWKRGGTVSGNSRRTPI